jgi:hypothetical protein
MASEILAQALVEDPDIPEGFQGDLILAPAA